MDATVDLTGNIERIDFAHSLLLCIPDSKPRSNVCILLVEARSCESWEKKFGSQSEQ